MKYFTYLPNIKYNSLMCRNILARGKIRNFLKNNSVLYYPYIVKDSDRADIISHKYYGSSVYTWLIYYVNDIIDPVFDWVLPYPQFNQYIAEKYGSIAIAKNQIYQYVNSDGLIIDYYTYLNSLGTERSIVYAYEYEVEKNEEKRNIKLLEDIYISGVTEEFRKLFI